MAIIVSDITPEDSDVKVVLIKHTNTMQDASGNDVEVVDYTGEMDVDEAIRQCEARKLRYETQLSDCEKELADYIAIRDAE